MYGVLDIGTTRTKIFIYDKNLKQIYKETINNVTYSDGTQDANHVANVTRHFLRVVKERGARKIGVGTYRASVVAWSKGGEPISPIYTWLYYNIEDIYKTVFRFVQNIPKLGILFKKYSPLFRFYKAYKEYKLRDCLKSGQCYLWTLDSYVAYLLTRRFISDATNATLTGLIHPKTFRKYR